MILSNLIDKSWYVANGYIDSFESIDVLEQYILYNYTILKKFKGIVIATTYKEQNTNLINANNNLWKKYFADAVLIDIKENRGHSFGIADSENALIDFCKENNLDWICKSSNDVIFNKKILDIKIEIADLYYLNGISYETLYLNSFDYEKIYYEHFYPQTNFYFIDSSKIDYLYDKEYVNETYKYRLTIPNYNNKIWEYIPGWACEEFLINCCDRNNLKKFYILPKELHIKLCEVVNYHKIGDPSHKNIFVNGVCHFQYPNENVIEI
jgi:hypothetical protein